jgi:hypothetical protein
LAPAESSSKVSPRRTLAVALAWGQQIGEQMQAVWQWLVDNWEFIFGVAGVIGLILALVIHLIERQPKQLDYEIRSDIRLAIPHADKFHEKVEITWESIRLKDPRLVVLRIRNTGKRSISRLDFEGGQPIRIEYERNQFFDAVIVRTSPALSPELAAESIWDDDKQYFLPSMLHPTEWFELQLLSDMDHGDIRATSRFADQRRPMRKIDPAEPRVRLRWVITTLATVTLINILGAISLAYRIGDQEPKPLYLLLGLAAFISSLFMLAAAIVSGKMWYSSGGTMDG